MLTRIQGNWHSPTFLVRTQNGPVISEDSLAISYEVKHTSVIRVDHCTAKYSPKRNKNMYLSLENPNGFPRRNKMEPRR